MSWTTSRRRLPAPARLDLEHPLAPPASGRGRGTRPRAHEPFPLQAVKGRVHRADGDVSACALLDLATHTDAVRIVSEP